MSSHRPFPTEPPVFFLDRNLGRRKIAQALREEGMQCEVHDDYLSPKASDEEWLKFASEKGWIAITKDKGIKRRKLFLHYLEEYSGRVLVITTKKQKAENMIECLLKGKNRIENFIKKNDAPFIVSISLNGMLTVYDLK